MIPLRDVIPSRTFPVITVTIIALNLLAWGYELMLSSRDLAVFLQQFGVVPAFFSWPTVISAMFLHGSWSHVAGNLLYLWIFGENVEDRMGRGRFVAFYLLCGVVTALGQAWMDPESTAPAIGASGAIAAVMGAYFVLYPNSRVLAAVPLVVYFDIIEMPAIFLLGVWFLLQLFDAGAIAVTAHTQEPAIAFMAQVGGFAMGLAGVFVFRRPERGDARWGVAPTDKSV